MELIVRTSDSAPSPLESPVEVVERKGLGHPDTICDALAERICIEFCQYYLQHFGTILHHNVDKILLCGGAARPTYGGGEVIEPLELYLAGRVTGEYQGETVPVHDIAVAACRRWLQQHLPALDVDRHVRIEPRFRPGSSSLTGFFKRPGAGIPLCNDTSCGVGFAPLTALETAVLEIENVLNSPPIQKMHPMIGQDIKIMGVRHGSAAHFTIACAMIGRHLRGLRGYRDAKAIVGEIALNTARRFLDGPIDTLVNAADDVEGGNVYLTVTGTSAESGDDGEVGRGNRVNGLITPYRPMTMEAAAGKNPISHIGKLYNLASRSIAQHASELPRVRSATCVLIGQVGRPVNDPWLVDLCLDRHSGSQPPALAPFEDLVRQELTRFPELLTGLLEERLMVY